MRFNYFTLVCLLAGIHVLVPLVLILWTWKKQNRSMLGWLFQIATFSLYFVFIFLAGSWTFVSFYFRYSLPVLFIIAAIVSYSRTKTLAFIEKGGLVSWLNRAADIVILVVLAWLIVGVIRANFYDEKPIDLSFPLRGGVYAIFEGGNGNASSLMNYHFGESTHREAGVNRSMKYAVDIDKLNACGNNAEGFLPTEIKRYAIFNETVYSPCDGEVFDIVDKWPNETPGTGTAPYNVGNSIVIKSGDFLVLIGHLQQGSFAVKKGEKIKRGQPVARAGNSGWTTQPHVHIQAMRPAAGSYWLGEGIPIYFDGKNPVKNTLFFMLP